jgi:hypothetical protein
VFSYSFGVVKTCLETIACLLHTHLLTKRETTDLRSASKTSDLKTDATKEERVLGGKAVDGIDNDEDHVPNVVSGLKA